MLNKILPIVGAIAGDVIGSRYELKGCRTKNYNFSLLEESSTYTDDTVLTIAVAKWAINSSIPLQDIIVNMCRNYAGVGYGHSFKEWLNSIDHKPYNSWGNGSAMRVSSIALVAHSIEEVMSIAKKTAEITHNHSEGIKGAQAVAAAVF